ncbi:helix-turn-helix domain-containing protein [Tenacibaculum jejuense]|uniref:Putative Transcriptional regulator, AraC family n=1 Tax=Tenacibaculum jejuense TaxID=584609 RepID=A0A238U952_9FLAO|nr:helix-turn-helix transcriptional regulator [Tenacibaculum jejuense]SNR14940.1 putative Transcriptional regulator, AraC family [Tenacibaculum jejuense]
MRIELSFFDLSVLIGITTGIVCSIILLKKSTIKKSNKFLALGILAFVWLNSKMLLLSLNLWEVHGFGYFPNSVEIAIPPLFYFYFLSIKNIDFKFKKKDWLHFIPFFISQMYSVIMYIVAMQTQVYSEKRLITDALFFNEAKNLDEYILMIMSGCYLYFGGLELKSFIIGLPKTNTKQDSEIKFLNILFFLLCTLSALHIINFTLNAVLDHSYNWRWDLHHSLIAAIVYYIAIIGFKNAEVILPQKNNNKENDVDISIIEKLNTAIISDKVYLNPKLTLKSLAKQLDISDTLLSSTINAHYQKNFRSLINEARVEEVKKRLLNGELDNLSLLGIAKECGFNSEASFYRIFKSETQITPKKFISNNLELSNSI